VEEHRYCRRGIRDPDCPDRGDESDGSRAQEARKQEPAVVVG